MEISKLEACKRQLNIAIYLYFHDMDLVSAHTLVWAARNVLFDIYKIKNISFTPENIITKLKKKNYENWLRGAQNFFKHASKKDEIKVFNLEEEMTENLLYDAIQRYSQIESPTNHMKIFISYFYIKNQEDISNIGVKTKIQNIIKKLKNKTPWKKEFYEFFKK